MESNPDYITTEGIYRVPGTWSSAQTMKRHIPKSKQMPKRLFSRLPSIVTILFLLLGEMSLLRKIREEVNQVQLKIILSKLHSQELYHILYHPRQSISKTNSLFHLMMRVEWFQLRVFGRHLKLAKTQLCSPTVSPSSLGSLQNHLYVNTFVWGWPPTCFAKIYF